MYIYEPPYAKTRFEALLAKMRNLASKFDDADIFD